MVVCLASGCVGDDCGLVVHPGVEGQTQHSPGMPFGDDRTIAPPGQPEHRGVSRTLGTGSHFLILTLNFA